MTKWSLPICQLWKLATFEKSGQVTLPAFLTILTSTRFLLPWIDLFFIVINFFALGKIFLEVYSKFDAFFFLFRRECETNSYGSKLMLMDFMMTFNSGRWLDISKLVNGKMAQKVNNNKIRTREKSMNINIGWFDFYGRVCRSAHWTVFISQT